MTRKSREEREEERRERRRAFQRETLIGLGPAISKAAMESAAYLDEASKTNSWSPGSLPTEWTAAAHQLSVLEGRVEDEHLREELLDKGFDVPLAAVYNVKSDSAASQIRKDLGQSADKALIHLGRLLRELY
jgi:hypothetical protein